jgi:hypothetical protein
MNTSELTTTKAPEGQSTSHAQKVARHRAAYDAWMDEMDRLEIALDTVRKRATIQGAEMERDGVLIDEVARTRAERIAAGEGLTLPALTLPAWTPNNP